MANIASFIKLLEDEYPDARLAAIETIDKLSKHGELKLYLPPDTADADMKLSFGVKLGPSFHGSSSCLKMDTLTFCRLPLGPLISLLNTVSYR
jgi:hypothetical protein